MLSRYTIRRGKAAKAHPPPAGRRYDIRKHISHALSPTPEMVESYLADPNESTWRRFAGDYRALIEQRFAEDAAPFDRLAEEARHEDVYLGCNCPTKTNPRVDRCHTWVALQFMEEHYPDLKVVCPDPRSRSAATR